MSLIKVETRIITAKEFNELRGSVDWEIIPDQIAQKGLENTIFSAIAHYEGQLAGMGRVVGDGFIYFYIQDMIVKPKFHNRGVGTAIVQSLLDSWTKTRKKKGAMMLVAAPGKQGFYEKFNFKKRSEDETSMVFP